jgi:hypothetical protein
MNFRVSFSEMALHGGCSLVPITKGAGAGIPMGKRPVLEGCMNQQIFDRERQIFHDETVLASPASFELREENPGMWRQRPELRFWLLVGSRFRGH